MTSSGSATVPPPSSRRRALGQLEVEVSDRDAAALADQCRRGRLADPPRAAGDRHDLATEGLPLLCHRDLLLGDR